MFIFQLLGFFVYLFFFLSVALCHRCGKQFIYLCSSFQSQIILSSSILSLSFFRLGAKVFVALIIIVIICEVIV